eukprot:9038425-Pyramimonas_sp.AAC.1
MEDSARGAQNDLSLSYRVRLNTDSKPFLEEGDPGRGPRALNIFTIALNIHRIALNIHRIALTIHTIALNRP